MSASYKCEYSVVFLLTALLKNDNSLLVFYVNYAEDEIISYISPNLPELTVLFRVTSLL